MSATLTTDTRDAARDTTRDAAPFVARLPLDHITPSSTNPRKTFDAQALQDLAASIASTGLLQPVTVRPHPTAPDYFELVAGERRWRAHLLTKRTTIDAIVRDLTDAEVEIVQTIENVQRADVPPLEEGEGFARLLATGLTATEVAQRIGKSAAHIRQRAALAALIPVAKTDLSAGRITIGAALELARVSADDQEEAIDVARGSTWRGPGTAKQVRDFLDREVLLQLGRAPFNRRDKALVPEAGPCTRCPKRTAVDGDLFADFAKKDDRCLDRACFASKVHAHVANAIGAATARMGAERFRQVYTIADTYSLDADRSALGRSDWTLIDLQQFADCPSALGVYDARSGAMAGQTVVICARPDGCRTHYPKRGDTASGDYAAHERAKAKAATAERQLLAAVTRDTVARIPFTRIPEHGAVAIPDTLLPLIAAQVAREVQNEPKVLACRMLGLDPSADAANDAPLDPTVYGAHGAGWGPTATLVHHIARYAAASDTPSVARVLTVLVLTSEAYCSPHGSDRAERIRALATVYGVDLAPLYREVAVALAPKRERLTADAVVLPCCPSCGQESASFLTRIDGACLDCRQRAKNAERDDPNHTIEDEGDRDIAGLDSEDDGDGVPNETTGAHDGE